MSTRISSLSMRTIVPSTTSPCLKLLMSESCSASSSSIVVGSGPVGRFATTGASSSASMSEAGGASVTSSASAVGESATSAAGASATAAGFSTSTAAAGSSATSAAADSSTSAVAAAGSATSAGVSATSATAAGALSATSAVADAAPSVPSVAGGAGASSSTATAASAASLSVVSSGSGLVSGAAGSSATAMAATVCSVAGASPEAVASGAGAVPPCCSSVKVILSPSWNSPPESRTAAEPRPGPSWEGEGSLVTLAGGPLLRADGTGHSSSTVRAPVGRESLARGIGGYNRGPCPSCLTSTSSPTPSMPPWRTGRSRAARTQMPLTVRGTPAELEALVGQRVTRDPAPGQVPRRRARSRPRRREPDAHRTLPARRARGEGAVRHRRRAVVRRPDGRTAPGRRLLDGRGRLAAGRRRARARSLSRPDPDGQGLPAPRGRRAARAGPREGRDGPRRPRPGADRSRSGASASGATRASSRTRCATRRSWPGSATPTRTRSCTRRGCSPSASGRRWPRRRSTSCTRRCGRRSRRRCCSCAKRVPPTFEKQVRDHLAVHNRGGEACPRCGARITQVTAGGFATAFCRGCQR